MKKKKYQLTCLILLLAVWCVNGYSQQRASIYGDKVKADVKMNYVYSLEEALKQAHIQKKPIFFNCFADWAVPCHAMNQEVFSNQEFCDYMNQHFINLFMEMTSPEAKPIAQKYQVKSFAHYLVLDPEGNVLLRISGGKKLPEFKESIMLALNPKTSLAGTEKIYQSGRYGKKELLNYLNVLDLANEHQRFKQVAKEYMPLLKPKEYTQQKNWPVIRSFIDSRNCELYQYLIDHKTEFEKNVGAKVINTFIESFFYIDLKKYAMGKETYDGVKMLNLYNEMVSVGLPDSCISYKVYHIAKLRGEKKYDELFSYLKESSKELRMVKLEIATSFEPSEMSDSQKESLVTYLRETAKELPDSTIKRQLEAIAKQAESNDGEGIKFERITFDQALAKAKDEHKLVFLDCYTSWCGPCRMMANQIFVLPEVGELFNKRFVNIKIDMEKGEGVSLAQRYKISAFPTMLILDGEGIVIQRVRGARDKQGLMRIAAAATPETGYTASKKAYEEGVRTGDVIYGYTSALKEAGELKDEQYKRIVADFFAQADDKAFCDRRSWKLIEMTVNDVHSKEFARLLALHDELADQNGAENVNNKIESVAWPFVTGYFNSEISSQEAMNVLSVISAGHYPKEYPLNVLARLVPMFHRNTPSEVLDFYEKQVAAIKNPADRFKIDRLLGYFMDKANAEETKRSQAYIRKSMAQSTPALAEKYQNLLQTLNNR